MIRRTSSTSASRSSSIGDAPWRNGSSSTTSWRGAPSTGQRPRGLPARVEPAILQRRHQRIRPRDTAPAVMSMQRRRDALPATTAAPARRPSRTPGTNCRTPCPGQRARAIATSRDRQPPATACRHDPATEGRRAPMRGAAGRGIEQLVAQECPGHLVVGQCLQERRPGESGPLEQLLQRCPIEGSSRRARGYPSIESNGRAVWSSGDPHRYLTPRQFSMASSSCPSCASSARTAARNSSYGSSSARPEPTYSRTPQTTTTSNLPSMSSIVPVTTST